MLRTGPLLQSFRQTHLDITLDISRQFSARIIEKPQLWHDSAAVESMRQKLSGVASRCLSGKSLDYGIFDPNTAALENSVITLITDRRNGQSVAFNALPMMEIEIDGIATELHHLGLVMIDPDYRQHGLSQILYGLTCFLLYFRNRMRPLWISSVTQVPAVVGMVAETFSDVYPNPIKNTPCTFTHLQIASRIMRHHTSQFGVENDADFESDQFIIRNAYTGGSNNLKKRFADAAMHRNPAYNQYCENKLDYDRGDDVLQIGRIDLNTARRYLMQQVPGNAARPLLVQAVIVLTKYITLPVVHWLDASSQMGSLRPW